MEGVIFCVKHTDMSWDTKLSYMCVLVFSYLTAAVG